MKNSNYIVLDCETGGLEPFENPITQIAFLTLDQYSLKELNRYETYVKPYNDLVIDQKALNATMVKMSDVNKGIDYKALVKNIIAYVKTANPSGRQGTRPIMVGHNTQFDIGFISYLFALDGKDVFDYFAKGHYDTLLLTKQMFDLDKKKDSEMSYALTQSCKRFGIELIDAHGAMNDVVATSKLFVAYCKHLRSETKIENNEVSTDTVGKRSRSAFEF